MGVRESQSHSATMATTFGKSCQTRHLLKDSEVADTDKRWSIGEATLRVSAEVSGSSGGGPSSSIIFAADINLELSFALIAAE